MDKKRIQRNEIELGDICYFNSENDSIQGEVLKIEEATWSKFLNGQECYKKYKNKQLKLSDLILEKVTHKKSIITLYGWLKIINGKEFLGEIKFSCIKYKIYQIG